MSLILIFRILLALGVMLVTFWGILLGVGAWRDWREKKDRRMRALVGLSPEEQQLLWSLKDREDIFHSLDTFNDGMLSCADPGFVATAGREPLKVLRACQQAGIEEWRIRAFRP